MDIVLSVITAFNLSTDNWNKCINFVSKLLHVKNRF